MSNGLNINTIINIVTTLTLIITLYYVIKYTKETARLGNINQELLNLNFDDRIPFVVATFEEGDLIRDIIFEIENIGTAMAFDIHLKIQPQFDVKDEVYNDYFNNNGAVKNGISQLKPRSKYRMFVVPVKVIAKHIDNGEHVNLNYKFKLNYKDKNNKPYENFLDVSLDKFFKRLDPHPERKSNEEKQLEAICKELNQISKKLDKIPTSGIKNRIFRRF